MLTCDQKMSLSVEIYCSVRLLDCLLKCIWITQCKDINCSVRLLVLAAEMALMSKKMNEEENRPVKGRGVKSRNKSMECHVLQLPIFLGS